MSLRRPQSRRERTLARIARIADRDTFVALRRHRALGGGRARSGPLTLTWIPPSARPQRSRAVTSAPDRPAVAFAISTSVGSAVVRNRLRRQLRALLHDTDMPLGAYLVGVAPDAAGLDSPTLRAQLDRCLAALPGPGPSFNP